MNINVKNLVRGAVIAAVYALLTIFLAPISSGLIQCRVAEAMCVLPYFTFSAVPGLFIGCLLANLLTGAPVYDVIFGSLATLLAAYITYLMRRRTAKHEQIPAMDGKQAACPVRGRVMKYFAPLPSVVCNALVVGALLVYVYGVGVPYWAAVGYVAAGQAVACYALGLPLLLILERHGKKLF